MTDVIQQAREALAHMEAAWEDDDVPLPADFQAIHNLLAEIDAGHLIDTREVMRLPGAGPRRAAGLEAVPPVPPAGGAAGDTPPGLPPPPGPPPPGFAVPEPGTMTRWPWQNPEGAA